MVDRSARVDGMVMGMNRRFLLSAAFLIGSIASCGDDAGPSPDGGDGGLVCAEPSTLAYNQPGCGANAPAPYCQGPTDACAGSFCDCDGTTHLGGCGFALRPYRYAGECVDSGSNDDAGSD